VAAEPVRPARLCHDSGRSQRGETLLETLLAIVILSAVAIAAYAGLSLAIRSSAEQREAAIATTVLRSAAERLQDPAAPYVPRAGCAGAETYGGLPAWPDGGPPVDVTVRFWIPPASVGDEALTTAFAEPGGPGDCPAVDPGLQSIELSITTPSGRTERLEVLKRGAHAAP